MRTVNEQLETHKEVMNDLYKNIAEKISTEKKKIIDKRNEKRDHPVDIEPGTIGYRKQSERQSKTNPLYKPEHILQSNDLTVTTTAKNKYHKQCFKKPRKLTDKSLLQIDDSLTNLDGTANTSTEP